MSTNRQNGSTPEAENADAVMTFRLTRSQQDHIRRRAELLDTSPSWYLRMLVQLDANECEEQAA